LLIRKARIKDVRDIQSLINRFAKKDEMLPRSLNEIYENIRDFFVCIDKGKIVGVSAIHVLWEDIAELRSIAVLQEYQGKGIGKMLLRHCIDEARRLGVKKVFALTYNPEFFRDSGFKDIDKNSLPQKIWRDCLKCPRFPECDEVAVIKDIKRPRGIGS